MKINAETLAECAGFEPLASFGRRRFFENLGKGYPFDTEANGLRQTGRSTRMLCKAIEKCTDNANVVIYVKNDVTTKMLLDKAEFILSKTTLGYKVSQEKRNIMIGTNYITFTNIGNGVAYFDDSINDG